MTYPQIETKADYAQYEAAVAAFAAREGIEGLHSFADDEGEFSWRPCECCGRPLGGTRYRCTAYHAETKQVLEYRVCVDCLYYSEYGHLDDMTMLQIESASE